MEMMVDLWLRHTATGNCGRMTIRLISDSFSGTVLPSIKKNPPGLLVRYWSLLWFFQVRSLITLRCGKMPTAIILEHKQRKYWDTLRYGKMSIGHTTSTFPATSRRTGYPNKRNKGHHGTIKVSSVAPLPKPWTMLRTAHQHLVVGNH